MKNSTFKLLVSSLFIVNLGFINPLAAQSINDKVSSAQTTIQDSQLGDDLNEAIDQLYLAINSGSKTAMFVLGKFLLEGEKIERNDDIGKNLLMEAASSGHVPSINYLTNRFLEEGRNDEAFNFLNRLSNAGVSPANINLAKLYLDSDSGFYNMDKAESYLNLLIDNAGGLENASKSEQALASKIFSMKLEVEADAKEIFIGKLDFLASVGNWPAADSLASVYIQGKYGITPDPVKGYGYLSRAADEGVPAAMFKLGQAYLTGNSIAINRKRGFELVESAASKNLKSAILMLAKETLEGSYSGYSKDAALEVLTEAADGGNSQVISALSDIYAKGLLGDDNREEALIYSKLLADSGNPRGQMLYADRLIEFGMTDQLDDIVQIYQASADTGNVDAMIRLVKLNLDEKVQPRNEAVANKIIIRILETDEPKGLAFLGGLFLRGKLVPQDPVRGVNYIQTAYNQGFSGVKSAYANLLIDGEHVPQDIDLGFEILSQLADEGNMGALTRLASLYLEKGQEYTDIQKGIATMRELTGRSGSQKPPVTLARIYLSGDGVEADKEEAFRYLLTAAERGNAWANLQVGNFYLRGDVVEKSVLKAQSYFKASADAGNKGALLRLGDAYLMTRNNKAALEAYQAAVDAGNERGSVSIAKAYLQEAQFPGKKTEGMKLLTQLSQYGVVSASMTLANIYQRGLFKFEIDNGKALSFYDAAINAGNSPAEGARLVLLSTINNSKDDWGNLELLFEDLSMQGKRTFVRVGIKKSEQFVAYLAQAKLQELNFYKGPLDGFFGTGSAAAMRSFCLEDAANGVCSTPEWSSKNVTRVLEYVKK